jgi:hypothetical protein
MRHRVRALILAYSRIHTPSRSFLENRNTGSSRPDDDTVQVSSAEMERLRTELGDASTAVEAQRAMIATVEAERERFAHALQASQLELTAATSASAATIAALQAELTGAQVARAAQEQTLQAELSTWQRRVQGLTADLDAARTAAGVQAEAARDAQARLTAMEQDVVRVGMCACECACASACTSARAC